MYRSPMMLLLRWTLRRVVHEFRRATPGRGSEVWIPPALCECLQRNHPDELIEYVVQQRLWIRNPSHLPRADINRDGNVNGADLGLLLANWGPCGQ